MEAPFAFDDGTKCCSQPVYLNGEIAERMKLYANETVVTSSCPGSVVICDSEEGVCNSRLVDPVLNDLTTSHNVTRVRGLNHKACSAAACAENSYCYDSRLEYYDDQGNMFNNKLSYVDFPDFVI